MSEVIGTAIFWLEDRKYEFDLPEKLNEVNRYIREHLLFECEVVVELRNGEIMAFDAYVEHIQQVKGADSGNKVLLA